MENQIFSSHKITRESAIKFIRDNGTKRVAGEDHKFYEFVDLSKYSDQQLYDVYLRVAKEIINPDRYDKN